MSEATTRSQAVVSAVASDADAGELAAVIRPLAEIVPEHYHLLLSLSGACWLLAFALFVAEYGPMLWTRKTRSA